MLKQCSRKIKKQKFRFLSRQKYTNCFHWIYTWPGTGQKPTRYKPTIQIKIWTKAHRLIHKYFFLHTMSKACAYVAIHVSGNPSHLCLCVIFNIVQDGSKNLHALCHIQHHTRWQCLPHCVIHIFCLFVLVSYSVPSYFCDRPFTPTWVGFCPDINFSVGLM